jgi:hypothetical protein
MDFGDYVNIRCVSLGCTHLLPNGILMGLLWRTVPVVAGPVTSMVSLLMG